LWIASTLTIAGDTEAAIAETAFEYDSRKAVASFKLVLAI
jgi:hypothetical protein